MHNMSNLEYSFMVQELQPLVGKHFSRIRKLGEGIYRMKIGSREIICELGVRLHGTKYMEEAAVPDRFVQKVEKELDNARLLSIEQINQDRIVSFTFNKGHLIFEMFGEGNAILVKDGNIVSAAKYESWAGREIKPGEPYKPPSVKPSEKLKLSDKYIIVSLTRLPLGKEYALEALARVGIDEKKPGTKLSKQEISKLEDELNNIRESAKPFLFLRNGKPVAFSLADLSEYTGLESNETGSLSEAADEYYAKLEKSDPQAEKLLRRLEQQEKRLLGLGEEEKMNKAKGDFIYERYSEVEEILGLAKSGKYDELEKRYKGKVNKKEKSVEVEIG